MTQKEDFTAWLCREMPAGTVIGDPAWWAPKIIAALSAPLDAQPVASIDSDEFLGRAIAAVSEAMSIGQCGEWESFIAHINAHTAAQVAASKAPVNNPIDKKAK